MVLSDQPLQPVYFIGSPSEATQPLLVGFVRFVWIVAVLHVCNPPTKMLD
jgi:hypothetical protein